MGGEAYNRFFLYVQHIFARYTTATTGHCLGGLVGYTFEATATWLEEDYGPV